MSIVASRSISQLVERATQLQESGDLPAARALCKEILELEPEHAKAWHLLGVIAYSNKRYRRASRFLRRSIASDPGEATTYSNLGAVLCCRDGHSDEAEQACREALRLQPEYPEAWNNLGLALYDQRRDEEAEQAYREAIKGQPDYTNAWNNLGLTLHRQDRREEADAAFRRAIQARPGFGAAWLNLVRFGCAGLLTADDVTRMQELLFHPKVSRWNSIYLNFALGKIEARRENFQQAFSYIDEGNRQHQDLVPHHADRVDDIIQRQQAAFTPEVFARFAGTGSASDRPIFVVGLPRCGKSLVEKVLACHPQVFPAGELTMLANEIAGKLQTLVGSSEDYPECVSALTPETVRIAADRYEQRLLRDAPQGIARVTDTLPLNTIHLGLAALLFPQAHIIWCRRDPMAAGQAIYFKYFAKASRFAYDLEDIGRFHRNNDRMMTHWQKVLPISVHEVSYEALVCDPEGIARSLFEHVGLVFDATVSEALDEIGLHTDLVDDWRHYEDKLTPLARALIEP